ncbi:MULTISPECIES: TIGR00153 family protein [Halomonadaceae]|jgi:predicted phosphate transport protein (TIGR00153 family)|uniref:TIGR00153 family protein n=1 Tax=Halomonadaceae TaxID=28256 RepID=UPI0015820434|nr:MULTISPECIES: TIGR00153 family protein [Halomonas]MDI4637179.1 TIGR00153 family protein [Halomonas sp. BMC7]NUJ58347.1 TIGR00153 family protein [Halomonas taeanensis]|tara:strand:- start:15816 stop:16496 length:681 start_codon:yes stop_codon:yes gene_type:complete
MVTSNPFSAIFGRSPFQPLLLHIVKVSECADELLPFFESTLSGDWEAAERHRGAITRIEHEADELKTELRLNLPNTMFLPVSRSDLLDLISVQDKIANKARDITGIMLGRQMQVPESLAPTMRDYLRTSVAAVSQARKALEELKDLLESGFGSNVADVMQNLIRELHSLEHQADDQQVAIRRQLFQLESELPPVDVIFLYKIIDWVGELSDGAERVGSRLQVLTAR